MNVLVQVSENLIRVAATAVLAAERDLVVIDRPGAPAVPGAIPRPDVIVRTAGDVSPPGRPRVISGARPPVVALLSHPGYEAVRRALRSGAAGLQCVSCHLTDLPAAVRAIGCGTTAWFAPCVAASIAAHLAGRDTDMDGYGLTPREALILKHIANGATNAEVATEVRLDIRTVKHHASSVFRKLGARNRAEAVALAYRLGLVA
jgi:DNA-binding NarL/FixJ family response regulator